MRFLLLLSALLTAFAGSVGGARAGVAQACQVCALIGAAATDARAAGAGQRPSVAMPSRCDVAAAPASVEVTAVTTVPLYFGRLRT
jgi:hypothetical protein